MQVPACRAAWAVARVESAPTALRASLHTTAMEVDSEKLLDELAALIHRDALPSALPLKTENADATREAKSSLRVKFRDINKDLLEKASQQTRKGALFSVVRRATADDQETDSESSDDEGATIQKQRTQGPTTALQPIIPKYDVNTSLPDFLDVLSDKSRVQVSSNADSIANVTGSAAGEGHDMFEYDENDW